MEKFKLKTGSRRLVRVHPAIFAILLIAAIAVGFVAGQKGIGSGVNCIPQQDLQYFINKANSFQEDYQKCVQDAWALHLICKTQTAGYKNLIANLTNSTN